jgi:hypothetical protein
MAGSITVEALYSDKWTSRAFIAVKSLYISRAFRPRIADALQMLVGESVTEVLPALQTLSWMSQAHRDLSRKTFPNLLPHNSLSVTLLPFYSGEVIFRS